MTTLKILGVLLLATFCGVARSQLSCSDAIMYHEYAVQVLENCGSGMDNSTLCELIGDAEEGSSSNGGPPKSYQKDQLYLTGNPVPSVQPWQNYLVQAALSSAADPGEVAYILSVITDSPDANYVNNATIDSYYGTWARGWWDQADANLALAANTDGAYDARAVQYFYWKAANYLFTGLWPYAFTEEAIERSQMSADAFISGLEAAPDLIYYTFNVSFNNGTATTQMPAVLVTPDNSQPLPTVIITTGTDFTKEATYLQFAPEITARGYAVLVYEGPGQGQVIRNEPFMPFYADWGAVLSAILDYIADNFTNIVQVDNIVQYGTSLGGYLGSQACAVNNDRLVACVPNPPQYSVATAYERFTQGLGEGVYGPLQYAAQTDESSLPPGYAAVFDNPIPILNSLLLNCSANSAAPSLVAEAFQLSPGIIDPELVYLAAGYGGVVSGDEDELYSGMWQAYRNVQEFGQYNVSDITIPVVAVKGTEDDLLGGQEDEWFSQLTPATQNISTLLTFDDTTGGALHCQVGAPLLLNGQLFAFLDPILTPNAPVVAPVPAPSPAMASLPVLASG